MNIANFINSKDIRDYLIETGYVFNSLEAAWLIYQNRSMNLEEKFMAWTEIIDTMPDCSVAERINCIEIPSLHSFLAEYIDLHKRLISDFRKYQEGWVYRYSSLYQGDRCFADSDGVFSSYEECMKEADSENEGMDVVEIKVEKLKINDRNLDMCMRIKSNGDIIDITAVGLNEHETDLCWNSFEGLWFYFPTPFQKGDIVVDLRYPESDGLNCGPFVVTEINTDPVKDKKAYERRLKSADNTDMTGFGYFQWDDGSLYHECQHNYMNLEYYRGELTGIKRTLKAASSLLKGEIDLGLFGNAYHEILLQEHTKSMMPNAYTSEGMILAGLKEPDSEDGK